MSRVLSRSVLFAFVVLISMPALWASAQDNGIQVGGVTVLPPDADYEGVSRAEWDARSWQYDLSFSMDASPSNDSSGASCGFGQNGPMFFLPGVFDPEATPATCVIPAGMAIYVTVGSSGCSSVEPPPFFGANEEELSACATGWGDSWGDMSASINGEEVPDVMSYRIITDMYTVSFPPNNIYEIEPAVGYSVSDTYSFIIAPPEPGEYTIEVSGTLDGEAWSATGIVLVTEPQVIMPEASPEAATPVS